MNFIAVIKHLLLDQFMLYGGGGKGGGGGSAPSPPDPYAVAGATTQTNQQTAAYNKDLNLNNYSNPFGSQQSQITGYGPSGAPIYNTSISADPNLQSALSSLLGQTGQSGQINQNALSGLNNLNWTSGYIGNAASAVNSQLNGYQNGALGLLPQYSGLNSQLAGLGSSLDPGAAKQAQQQGQDAAYAAQKQYLDPQFSQQGESLDAKLANQGLTPGSEAYNNAQLNQSNAKQQAYSNAQNQAILTGSQIGAQNLQNQISGINTQAGLLGQQASNVGQQAGLYGLGGQLAQGQLGSLGTWLNANNQSASLYGQQAAIGQTPYGNLSSIASMIPGYAGPAQSSTSPSNIGQNIYSNYQGQLNNYNAGQQSSNQFTGGLFGLGSAGILGYAMSDRRCKRDIEQIGTLENGIPWYEFRYVWDRITDPKRQGVMADEVRRIKPEAVGTHVSGLEMVDYEQVM